MRRGSHLPPCFRENGICYPLLLVHELQWCPMWQSRLYDTWKILPSIPAFFQHSFEVPPLVIFSIFKKSACSFTPCSTACPQKPLPPLITPVRPPPHKGLSPDFYIFLFTLWQVILLTFYSITIIKFRSRQKLNINENWKGKDKILIIWDNSNIYFLWVPICEFRSFQKV